MPPKALRVRGNLPPNRKIIAISGSRETTNQALDDRIQNRKNARSIRIYNRYVGLAHGCDTAAD